ncbi:MAG: BolA family transcriptional regulator [Rhodospirillaceae bacterium]|jgi:BolA family transcriptional regulator, general stress-responsive regulator|nr:BolA family transcriptional regulator [Rhodospirillaceae bacterium]MBT5457521.1 BolA family transcriptional regulator [Rhodospirillaceae bacterium]
MIVQQSIEAKLVGGLTPAHLEILNESHMHSVPSNSETHFKVIVVSDIFAGMTRVARHQAVNGLLADELAGPVHALSIQAHTADEWTARGGSVLDSPECLGGGKADVAG